jgi:biotin operon repressor
MSQGWISLHRKLQNNPLWSSEPFTRGQAWVDLILLANHEEGYIYVRDHKIELKRGDVGWSQNRLSERWQWSRTKIRKFLNDLEKEQQIKQLKSKSYTVIRLINYNDYQSKEQQEDKRKTTGRQQEDTNNNDNNVNNDNKSVIALASDVPNASDSETWQSAIRITNRLLESICEYDPTHRYNRNKPSLTGWVKDIDKAIRLDGRTEEQLNFIIDYIFQHNGKHSAFWASNVESGEKLRKQFDQIKNQIKDERNKTTGHKVASIRQRSDSEVSDSLW